MIEVPIAPGVTPSMVAHGSSGGETMKFFVGVLFFVAFGAMGLLVGALCGLSASPLAQSVVALTFSLIGGSILHVFTRQETTDRIYSLLALFAFSASTLFGVIAAIYVTENQMLTPDGRRTGESRPYLRGSDPLCVDRIAVQVEAGLPKDAAYDAVMENCLTRSE